jgi:hypothetical protein
MKSQEKRMNKHWQGILSKMRVEHCDPVGYEIVDALDSQKESLKLNPIIGMKMQISFDGKITCVNCSRSIKKTFGQGLCYPCFTTIPQADICIFKPELCHFDDSANPCRDRDWGLKYCFSPHILYLAVSSGLKVGITNEVNVPSRWIDQGADRAVPVMRFADRLSVGLAEKWLSSHFDDKTNWQRMLKNIIPEVDLAAARETLLEILPANLAGEVLANPEIRTFSYPSLNWPLKVRSLKLKPGSVIKGELQAIKGQYLLFDCGVFNVRSHSGFSINLEVL